MEALGVEMLLKVRIGDTMTTVAGLMTDQVLVDNESIDITNKGHQSWRTLLAGGKRMVDISAMAYVLDDAGQTLLKQSHVDNVSLICEVSDGIDSGFSGTFIIGTLNIDGSYDGAEEISITLHSLDASVDPGFVPPPVIVPMTPASTVSGWTIDPLFSYVVRQPVVTHKITTFTSQNL